MAIGRRTVTMWDFLRRLLDPTGFPARWSCGLWTPAHGYLHIVSDTAIFAAYTAIPLLLAYLFVKRRADVPFPRVAWLFIAFILCCGLSHALEALIFYHPLYRLAGATKLATAMVSWGTVFALVPTLPKAFALRSPLQLERMVADRTEELARVNARLEDQQDELERMMRMVSHDLKSPLVTSRGFLGVLREELGPRGGDPTVADALERIDRAQERMKRLIDDLLAVSRLGVVPATFGETDLARIVRDVVSELRPRAEDRGALLVVEGEQPLPIVGDGQRLSQAIDNLVANALTHGCPTPGCTVRVRTRRTEDGRGVEVVVEDDGPGVPADARSAIFEAFQRRSREDGTGVGLAIVLRVARDHGGTAYVEDRGDAPGARFVLALRPPRRVPGLPIPSAMGSPHPVAG